ncbi:hypothetical protein T07_10070 [Trichinella nelsoni]|uniref:Uncharacterized protein n=1 Tax=Trichinella nelsoni TaxID=6336 RepID=A0A0V0S9P9_9BILA|nr:hypothetical protein T07_10070 [Trichinella nelsoni]
MKFFNNGNGEAIGETGIAQASKYKKCHMKLGKKVARYQIATKNHTHPHSEQSSFVGKIRLTLHQIQFSTFHYIVCKWLKFFQKIRCEIATTLLMHYFCSILAYLFIKILITNGVAFYSNARVLRVGKHLHVSSAAP